MGDSALLMVQNLSVLEEGDHIKWKRLPGYDHHAIVESVDHKTGKVHVIEYGSDTGGSGTGKGVVRRYEVHDVKSMYKYKYDKCHDAQVVLKRAKSRLGERQYGPFRHNCEHFATWCKKGEARCSQILPFMARTGISGAEGVNGGWGTAAGRCAAKCSVEAAKNGTTATTELRSMLTSGGVKDAITELYNAVVDGGKEMGKNAIKSRFEVGVLFSLSVAIEGGLFAYNCYKAQQNYNAAVKYAENDDMKLTCKAGRNKDIKEAACEGIGGVAGGTALGAALGSCVPIPVVGTAVGALVGNVAGRVLGRMSGRWLFY